MGNQRVKMQDLCCIGRNSEAPDALFDKQGCVQEQSLHLTNEVNVQVSYLLVHECFTAATLVDLVSTVCSHILEIRVFAPQRAVWVW